MGGALEGGSGDPADFGGFDCRPYGEEEGDGHGQGADAGGKFSGGDGDGRHDAGDSVGGGGGGGGGREGGVEDDFPVCFASVTLHAVTNLLCFPGFCVDDEAAEW